MKIRAILDEFSKRINSVCDEQTKHLPVAFQVNWRDSNFNTPVIDMRESYWYFEDDGCIVFRINDTDEDAELNIGTFIEFKQELDNFLNEYGDKDQLKDAVIDNYEVVDAFYFFTKEDALSGSYWSVSQFTIYNDGDKIIIAIEDWG